jgi:hypothetical protein
MAPAPCSREPSPRSERKSPLLLVVSLGWEIAATTGLFAFFGWWLSSRLHSPVPLFVSSLFGIGLGLWRFFRQVTKL